MTYVRTRWVYLASDPISGHKRAFSTLSDAEVWANPCYEVKRLPVEKWLDDFGQDQATDSEEAA